MAEAPLEELEELVRTTGFYRNKALSLKETSKTLVEEFNGEVPKTMDELLTYVVRPKNRQCCTGKCLWYQ